MHCRHPADGDDEGFDEILAILKRRWGAVERGRPLSPYSLIADLELVGRAVTLMDDWGLTLSARDDAAFLEQFIPTLLAALNEPAA